MSGADQSSGEKRKFNMLVPGRRVQNCYIQIVENMVLQEDVSCVAVFRNEESWTNPYRERAYFCKKQEDYVSMAWSM